MIKYLFNRRKEIGFDLFIEILAWILILGIVFVFEKYFDFLNIFLNDTISKYKGLIVVLFSLFLLRAIWLLSKILKKLNNLLEEELPIIISDTNTIFEQSSIQNLTFNTTAKIATKHPSWQEKDMEFSKELRNSQWIAHTDFASSKEVVGSGIFIFFKEFEIPDHVVELKTCDLFFLVDDTCSIVINGKTLTDNIEGRKELHYFYIKDYLKKGNNQIRFHINNEYSDTSMKLITKNEHKFQLTDEDIAEESETKMNNWYGLRFCIRITYIAN